MPHCITSVKSLFVKLKRFLRPSKLRLSGQYSSYMQALDASTGYSDSHILSKVLKATKAVLSREYAYERDGFLFNSFPKDLKIYTILSKLDLEGSTVVDFGGGLGGLFINNKNIFASCSSLIVIEQESFAIAGTRLANEYNLPIQFITDMHSIQVAPRVVVFSSVLQYLPNPYDILKDALRLCPEYIILDRTAFGPDEFWSIQINDGVYTNNATYPHRCLRMRTVKELLSSYSLRYIWTNPFDPQIPLHQGMLFARV